MRLLDIVTSPWAVMPDKLDEIRTIYETHMRGEKIDIKAVEARLGRPLSNDQTPYEVVDGVAIVPMVGVLAKRANMFMSISGGASTQMLGEMLSAAVDDPSVRAIVLAVDSPGGAVDGVQQLANQVRAVRGVKPIVTVADGAIASGAYWIGSGADNVYLADLTTLAGSIGVVYTHVDTSARQAQSGVKNTDITAGKYKRIASGNAPLSEEGLATIQGQVDQLYSVFVNDVATNRGVSVDQVLSDMADGRVFVGQQAIDAGLVDGVSTLAEVVAQLAASSNRAGVARNVKPPSSKGNASMDMQQLKAEHPQLHAAILAEGHAAGMLEGQTAGATAERARILGIEANAIPGHDVLVAELKADGKTTPDQAAGRILAAERSVIQGRADALRGDAPPPAAAAAAPAAEASAEDASKVAQAQALAAKEGIDIVTALKRVGVK